MKGSRESSLARGEGAHLAGDGLGQWRELESRCQSRDPRAELEAKTAFDNAEQDKGAPSGFRTLEEFKAHKMKLYQKHCEVRVWRKGVGFDDVNTPLSWYTTWMFKMAARFQPEIDRIEHETANLGQEYSNAELEA